MTKNVEVAENPVLPAPGQRYDPIQEAIRNQQIQDYLRTLKQAVDDLQDQIDGHHP